ncbi:unnamed protein product [Blumeria hordei]|uniref:Uncharacterized protein n=1 Tax=Blumeria hordei TaxID=2867405 RepID=A0A383UZ32_BLUHO|nr:unnamed protein product [Blumeria hordei]
MRRGTVSPKKRKRTSSRLKADYVNQIISYVESSPENHRKFFLELGSGPSRYLGASGRVTQIELQKRGCLRHIAHLKPLLSQKTTKTGRQIYGQTKPG